jgi:hypothetical protein
VSDILFSLHSWPQAILHIDGDAFFTSCEEAIHPELRGKARFYNVLDLVNQLEQEKLDNRGGKLAGNRLLPVGNGGSSPVPATPLKRWG